MKFGVSGTVLFTQPMQNSPHTGMDQNLHKWKPRYAGTSCTMLLQNVESLSKFLR
jgi:hypothetical protein